MNRFLFFSTIALILISGCTKPTEVRLQDGFAEGPIEIEAIAPADSNVRRGSVDSTALLPAEFDTFAGRVMLNHVKDDHGTGIRTVAFSRVIFENRLRPIVAGNRLRGFWGIPLGIVRLNTDPMILRERRIHGLPAGFEYVKDLTSTYLPLSTYTWLASPDSIGAVAVSIESPADLNVVSPVGGSVISRNHDLPIRWMGSGDLILIVSTIDQAGRELKPILHARIHNRPGVAVFPKKLLRTLPPASRFVFTFALVSREEFAVSRFSGKVLVQAASIYNSHVEIP